MGASNPSSSTEPDGRRGPRKIAPSCSATQLAVAIGDLNGDGKLDLAVANLIPSTVSVLINAPGLCTVPDVRRMTLPAAKRTIARAVCHVGKVRRAYSNGRKWLRVRRGLVISQKPKRGAVLPNGGKVNLVVSRGRKH